MVDRPPVFQMKGNPHFRPIDAIHSPLAVVMGEVFWHGDVDLFHEGLDVAFVYAGLIVLGGTVFAIDQTDGDGPFDAVKSTKFRRRNSQNWEGPDLYPNRQRDHMF